MVINNEVMIICKFNNKSEARTAIRRSRLGHKGHPDSNRGRIEDNSLNTLNAVLIERKVKKGDFLRPGNIYTGLTTFKRKRNPRLFILFLEGFRGHEGTTASYACSNGWKGGEGCDGTPTAEVNWVSKRAEIYPHPQVDASMESVFQQSLRINPDVYIISERRPIQA